MPEMRVLQMMEVLHWTLMKTCKEKREGENNSIGRVFMGLLHWVIALWDFTLHPGKSLEILGVHLLPWDIIFHRGKAIGIHVQWFAIYSPVMDDGFP